MAGPIAVCSCTVFLDRLEKDLEVDIRLTMNRVEDWEYEDSICLS